MLLSEAIRDFGDYSRHELGHSTSTYYCYISWLRNFSKWLAEQGMNDPPIREINAGIIRRFSYSLSGRNLRPRTIRGALNALRALFTFLVEQGALAENPTHDIRFPKRDAAIRLLVTDEDLVKLLEAAERQHSTFRSLRDRAVISVLIFCGLRRQELLDLTVHAINLADESLMVQQGKGGKSRTVYLCEEVLNALREWLALRETMTPEGDSLFITEKRRRMGETTFAHMLEEVKAIAGLKDDPRIKPHSIRHAAATRLLRNGADIRSIQTWLGHAHLQTTAVYLHTDEEQVRKIASLASLPKPESDKKNEEEKCRSVSPHPWRRKPSR